MKRVTLNVCRGHVNTTRPMHVNTALIESVEDFRPASTAEDNAHPATSTVRMQSSQTYEVHGTADEVLAAIAAAAA